MVICFYILSITFLKVFFPFDAVEPIFTIVW